MVFPWVTLLILVCCSADTKAILSRKLHGTVSSYDSLLPSFRTPSALGLLLLFFWLVQLTVSLNAAVFCETCYASCTERCWHGDPSEFFHGKHRRREKK